jgi:hypothetical protein
LIKVQSVLRNEIREKLLNCFESLTVELQSFPNTPGTRDLLNALARANTNTQTALNTVHSWFKRSEVYDRQDYTVDFPVHIALNMVQKTIPSGSQNLNVRIFSPPENIVAPGRTLDAMVDVFEGLLENAVERSGLSIEELQIEVTIDYSDNSYSASIKNNVASHKPTSEDNDRVMKAKDSLHKSDSRRKAQLEGGSGLHKIWRAINSPIYREPHLDFQFDSDGSFIVNLGYKIERSEDEISFN